MNDKQFMARKYVPNKFVNFVLFNFGSDFFQVWPFGSMLFRQLSEDEKKIMQEAERNGTLAETYKAVKEGKHDSKKV